MNSISDATRRLTAASKPLTALLVVFASLVVFSGTAVAASAGADPSQYAAPSCDTTVSSHSALVEKVDSDGTSDASVGDTVCVDVNISGQGTVEILQDGITVASKGMMHEISASSGPVVQVHADDVEFTGFDVNYTGSGTNEAGQAIEVDAEVGESNEDGDDNVTVSYLKASGYDKGVVVDYSENVTLRHVDAQSENDEAVTIYVAKNVVLDHLTVSSAGGSATDNKGELDPGIWIDGKDVTVKNIRAEGTESGGIVVEEFSNSVDISGITVRDSEFVGAEPDIVERNTASGVVVDAEQNYFGSDGVQVSGDVDYAPWLGSEPETSTQTYYTDNSSYGGIQEAVDAASSGDTVAPVAGTYVVSSPVEIDESDLTLRGGGEATVRFEPQSAPSASSVVSIRDDADGTVMTGFNLVRQVPQDRPADTGHGQGVRISGSDVLLKENHIQVVGETKEERIAGVNVIEDYSGSGQDVSNVTLTGNTVEGFYGGVLVSSAYPGHISEVDVSENTIRGNIYGAVAKTHEDTDQATSMTVDGNVITQNDVGLYLTGSDEQFDNYPVYPFKADELTVTDNNFTENTIQTEDASGTADVAGLIQNNDFDRAVVVRGSPYMHTVWSSIQDAVTAAEANDTVEVLPGTYDEDVAVGVENLTLEGPNAGLTAHSAQRDSEEEAIVEGSVTVKSDNVKVTGLKIDSSGEAVVLANYGEPQSIDTTTVLNNIIEADSNGVRVSGAGPTKRVTVTGNEITSTGAAVNVFGGTVHQMIEIRNNTLNGDPAGLRDIGTLSFKRNRVNDSEDGGVDLQNVTDATISHNEFENFDSGAISVNVWKNGGEVIKGVETTVNAEIHQNEFRNSDGVGIDARAASNNSTLNAERNYWGHPSGPSGEGNGKGSAVYGDVDYVPWLPVPQAGKGQLKITPASLTLNTGQSREVRARFIGENGSMDVTGKVDWNAPPGTSISGNTLTASEDGKGQLFATYDSSQVAGEFKDSVMVEVNTVDNSASTGGGGGGGVTLPDEASDVAQETTEETPENETGQVEAEQPETPPGQQEEGQEQPQENQPEEGTGQQEEGAEDQEGQESQQQVDQEPQQPAGPTGLFAGAVPEVVGSVFETIGSFLPF